LSPGAVCYCGGIGLDISFDLGVIERFGCTVHAFDPTPAAIRHATAAAAGSPRFNLHPVGLWSSDCTMEIFEPASGEEQYSVADRGRTGRSIEAEFRAIPSLMSELGHDHIDVLKLDHRRRGDVAVPEPICAPCSACRWSGSSATSPAKHTARIDQKEELSKAYRGTALLLGDVVEADDAYTGRHSHDVVSLVLAVSDRMGLDANSRRDAELTALLHDVGKVTIPKSIIQKPGPLTAEERSLIEQHTLSQAESAATSS